MKINPEYNYHSLLSLIAQKEYYDKYKIDIFDNPTKHDDEMLTHEGAATHTPIVTHELMTTDGSKLKLSYDAERKTINGYVAAHVNIM